MTRILGGKDKARITISPYLERKSELGQFFTPSNISKFMAELFDIDRMKNPRLLDAGAGIGTLTSAFLDRLQDERLSNRAIVNAVEVDDSLLPFLSKNMERFIERMSLDLNIINNDFIEWAVGLLHDEGALFGGKCKRYTHAILNPPYKKIRSNSRHRKILSSVGIETVNLYSAFLGLVIELMEVKGQIVAIIPRSFCNGPYFKPFRQLLLEKTSIKHIHLFDSRDKAFKDDEVLQENVIVLLERGVLQGDVMISTSKDDSFIDYSENIYTFDMIVNPKDIEKFIHIPTSKEESFLEKYPNVCYSLRDIDIEVSTGPVVDFRVKEYLREMPEKGAVPLLYPHHFVNTVLDYPKESKKPNAIVRAEKVEKWLYPSGYYTVVKRFSSKEEKRRIVAAVLNPNQLNYPVIGFENHFNVFHFQKGGIDPDVAYGLYAYLNSTAVDKYFRVFNGHTQVNATDLRNMKYPSRQKLQEFGRWVMTNSAGIGQEEIDIKLEELLN